MIYPRKNIEELNNMAPRDIKWAIVGSKGYLDPLFPSSSKFIHTVSKSGKDQMSIRGFQTTTMTIKWRKNKESDRIQWRNAEYPIEGRHPHPLLNLPFAVLTLTEIENRYFYCLGLAVVIVLSGSTALHAYFHRDVSSSQIINIQAHQVPSLTGMTKEIEEKGFKLDTSNTQRTIESLFAYLWMHLPYDFTGHDGLVKMKTLEKIGTVLAV